VEDRDTQDRLDTVVSMDNQVIAVSLGILDKADILESVLLGIVVLVLLVIVEKVDIQELEHLVTVELADTLV
jgi:hypothetical protein